MKDKEIERLSKLKEEELKLYESGFEYVCGIDEAGRGPLAGPVVVASVILPKNSMIEGVNDSKKVSEKKREKIYEEIIKEAISYGIAIIDEKEIDDINILKATKKGVTECIRNLEVKPNIILIDALEGIDTLQIPYKSVIKGDAKHYSIAAASILAKVTRDRIMRQYDLLYPEYGFIQNKGYGTAKHIQVIKEKGICEIHRRTFVKKFI